MKKIINSLGKILLTIISFILAGIFLIFLVYLIPIDSIEENVSESVYIFENEKTYPILTNICTSCLDNFTDAIMLSTASYSGKENAFEKALMAYRYDAKDKNLKPDEILVNYHKNEEKDDYDIRSYSRYWHGYLIFLKPLLTFFNYGQIRALNLVIQTFLNIVVIYLMHKKSLSQYILPYIISICAIMPIALAFSMQFSSIFYIIAIALITILCLKDKKCYKDYLYILFVIIGILTSYLDLLTYPIATFGVPMVLIMCINETKSIKENLKTMFHYFVCWGIGYVGMWAGKWILATIFTDVNVIENAFSRITLHTLTTAVEEKKSILYIILKNIYYFIKTPAIIIGIIFVIYKIFEIIKRNIKLDKTILTIFIIISFLPIFWYTFASNHSFVHYWFTNKSLIVTCFSILCMFAKITSRNE